MNAAQLLHGCIDKVHQVVINGHVTGYGYRSATLGVDFRSYLLGIFQFKIAYRYGGSGFSQHFAAGFSNAIAPTGYNGDFAFE
jgi:hypothetical protein